MILFLQLERQQRTRRISIYKYTFISILLLALQYLDCQKLQREIDNAGFEFFIYSIIYLYNKCCSCHNNTSPFRIYLIIRLILETIPHSKTAMYVEELEIKDTALRIIPKLIQRLNPKKIKGTQPRYPRQSKRKVKNWRIAAKCFTIELWKCRCAIHLCNKSKVWCVGGLKFVPYYWLL